MKKIKLLLGFLFVFMLIGCDFLVKPIIQDAESKVNKGKRAVLTIINDSSIPITDISYSGGPLVVYSEWGELSEQKILNPGNSCEVSVYGDAQGYIFFLVGNKKYHTQTRYNLSLGETKTVTLANNTPVVDDSDNYSLLGKLSNTGTPSVPVVKSAKIFFSNDIVCHRDDYGKTSVSNGETINVGETLVFSTGLLTGERIDYWTINGVKVDNTKDSYIYKYTVKADDIQVDYNGTKGIMFEVKKS